MRIKWDHVCKGVTTWCLTHDRSPNGDDRYDNPDTMGPAISVSPRLNHPHAFSVDGTSRMQNFNRIPLPNIPNIKNSVCPPQGLTPWAQPHCQSYKKNYFGQRKVAHLICSFFFFLKASLMLMKETFRGVRNITYVNRGVGSVVYAFVKMHCTVKF